MEAVFRHFNHLASFYDQKKLRCRFPTADSFTFTSLSKLVFAPEGYHASKGHSIKGFHSMCLDAFYDLQKHTYSDTLVQPTRQKDKPSTFCKMADRHDLLIGAKDVFIGDRGYCPYSNTAHVKEKGQYFLFRTKDIHSKGLARSLEFPGVDSSDTQVNVTLVHSHKKEISIKEGYYKRFVDVAVSFDYVAYGSLDTHDLSPRIVRFPISDDSYECTATNLLSDGSPSEQMKFLYYARWVIEGSFRKLKYTVGLSNFHAYKPEYIR